MDKEILKRHNFVYLTEDGRRQILKKIKDSYQGIALDMVTEVFCGTINIPGFVRRDDSGKDLSSGCEIPLGFVHPGRIDGNRLRIGTYASAETILKIETPYDVLTAATSAKIRNRCMDAAVKIADVSKKYGLQTGVLGSAGLELATGLHYTDEASDLDFLVKPASLDVLHKFYDEARTLYPKMNMDFEVDFPNGYGVKLAELFMETRTVLGKSIDNIDLLFRKDIMRYLI